MPLGTFEKTAFRIINQLAQSINQLTQVFNNLGSFVYADLILSMKALGMKALGSFETTTFRIINELISLI